ncbi:adenylyltransferase/cytidyltransferase family protein [bacterium]|nr:MAG: adenylyltransferase/cytidyltransferase family protein [bacterium]
MTLLSKDVALGRNLGAQDSAKFSSNNSDLTRIMVFGTFDIVHPGHRDFFSQARKLAKKPFLIVSIARDKNVLRIKGRRPSKNQFERRILVQSAPEVDKAVVGGYRDHIPHILKESPQIIAIGYDQVAYVKGLKTLLASKGLKVRIVKLKAYKPHLYKTSIISKRQAASEKIKSAPSKSRR